MRPLTDKALLDLQEHGRLAAPAQRTLLLLAAAMSELGPDNPLALSVGEGDAALLRLRRATFGTLLPAEIACPHCAEVLEFSLDADALLGGYQPPLAHGFELDDGTRFRLPTHADLAAIAGMRDAELAVRRLAALCRQDRGEEVMDDTIAMVDARCAALDPGALIRLRLDCAACGHDWSEVFDIGTYFWAEIEQRVHVLLDEIHVLASRYGWPEADILALPAARRAAYLKRCDL